MMSVGRSTVEGMAIARNPQFAIDCPDPLALADFYGAILGWEAKGLFPDEGVGRPGASVRR